MGALYQLRSNFKKMPGQEFYVDGPYDTWGYVIKSEHKPEKGQREEWLNLIRGTGKTRIGEY